ncbi:tRNA lysidine(34) synthetase TilS [uncultured Roseobacter sp.]|uniref:tRNA lysidine(34) synthetase TilS n=1 Tax=uncultured Roseobacter sp. TaxID=114847 RepID=UPI002629020A|nr:tRNA lysidine(34) synthetase TilS [uncultured Roseobacter sp.]
MRNGASRDLREAVAQQLPPDLPKRLGVAVSGGGDSVALLHLLHEIARNQRLQLCAVTINHGLRTEAEVEAAFVAELCAGLDIPHKVLRWDGWTGQGNLQNAAREARYSLIAAWAKSQQLSHVALGHTQDDQAETVLMRLARGAGVDGLAAMGPSRARDGITWLRPLLQVSRASLREMLQDREIRWCEDPSNDDLRFDRIKLRQALTVLEPLGISAAALSQVADNMARTRIALNAHAVSAARKITTEQAGALKVDWSGFDALPAETARRIMIRALQWISGAGYAPRGRSVQKLMDGLRAGHNGTLEGCHVIRSKGAMWIYRELDPVRHLSCDIADVWDNRWQLTSKADEIDQPDAGLRIAALGERGLRDFPQWRALGCPRDALLATPAVWKDDQLVAAPLAGTATRWHATLVKGEKAFFDALLSH